jgi:cytochrome c oxidase cbb3-type subunit IV
MHETLAQFAQTWGMIYAIALFGVAVGYALWPRNKATFDRAASAPLRDGNDLDGDEHVG